MMSPCDGPACRCRKPARIYQNAVVIPRWFNLFCIALILAAVWAGARIHARTNPLKIGPLEMGPRSR